MVKLLKSVAASAGSRTRMWVGIAVWTAQVTAVVTTDVLDISRGRQITVAYWRNNQIPDQSIRRRQRLLDTGSVGAVGDIQFCSDFLLGQLNQPITAALSTAT